MINKPNNVEVEFVNPVAANSQAEGGMPDPAASVVHAVTAEAVTPIAVVTPAEARALYLSAPQSVAIIQLTSGATKSAAAAAAGVTRATLYNWLTHDANFQAAYNAWQKDVMTTAQAQLLAASQDAIACVLTAIRKGDAHLAWKLLQSQGLTRLEKPGSTDVGFLQRKEELERKSADIKERKKARDLDLEDLIT